VTLDNITLGEVCCFNHNVVEREVDNTIEEAVNNATEAISDAV